MTELETKIRYLLRSLPEPREIAGMIDIDLSEWPGNCFGVADAFVNNGLVDGKAVFGHYRGPVAPGTMFSGRGIIQHGWVDLGHDLVCDPTRFVFEGVEPYVFIGPNQDDEYDRGGQRFQMAKSQPLPPAPDLTTREVSLEIDDQPTLRWMDALFGSTSCTLHLNQVFWLANLSTRILGQTARPLHDAIADAGLKALIPVDNWNISREQDPPAPTP